VDLDTGNLAQAVRRELAKQLSQPEVWLEVVQEALATVASLNLWRLPAVLAPRRSEPNNVSEDGLRDALESGPVMLPVVGPVPLAATFPNPAAFRISSPNGMVFDAPVGGGNIPVEGSGARFMWYPGKNALRAGYVSGSQWDNVNIGTCSTAMGFETTASGNTSTAMGDGSIASGEFSTAIGARTNATGASSTAMAPPPPPVATCPRPWAATPKPAAGSPPPWASIHPPNPPTRQ
jgi:hypothetical protein